MAHPITLLHVSDLHFGKEDGNKRSALLDLAKTLKPDLVCVTGDIADSPRKKFSRRAQFFELLEGAMQSERISGPWQS